MKGVPIKGLLAGVPLLLALGGSFAQEASHPPQLSAEKEERILSEIRRSTQEAFEPGEAGFLEGGGTDVEPVPVEGIGGLTIRITLILVLFAVLLLGGGWGIRRLGLAGTSRPGGGAMEVLEGLALGQNRSLLLARVMDKVYLLGTTPHQIAELDRWEGEQALEVIANTRGGMSMTRFKDLFAAFVKRGAKSA